MGPAGYPHTGRGWTPRAVSAERVCRRNTAASLPAPASGGTHDAWACPPCPSCTGSQGHDASERCSEPICTHGDTRRPQQTSKGTERRGQRHLPQHSTSLPCPEGFSLPDEENVTKSSWIVESLPWIMPEHGTTEAPSQTQAALPGGAGGLGWSGRSDPHTRSGLGRKPLSSLSYGVSQL